MSSAFIRGVGLAKSQIERFDASPFYREYIKMKIISKDSEFLAIITYRQRSMYDHQAKVLQIECSYLVAENPRNNFKSALCKKCFHLIYNTHQAVKLTNWTLVSWL